MNRMSEISCFGMKRCKCETQLFAARPNAIVNDNDSSYGWGLSVGDLTFGECRPGVSPKCIVRCRDNDIDLSYHGVESSRVKSRRDVRLCRGVKNKRDSLSLSVSGKEGDGEKGSEIASRKRSIDRVIADARPTIRRALFYSTLPQEVRYLERVT